MFNRHLEGVPIGSGGSESDTVLQQTAGNLGLVNMNTSVTSRTHESYQVQPWELRKAIGDLARRRSPPGPHFG
jgi:hypothetical protein